MTTAATNNEHEGLVVSEDRACICGWPTDILTIDHRDGNSVAVPHTLLLFIPGNPGVVHWYTDWLAQIVKRLGRGFAVRGVSYAGHGVGEDVIGTKDDHKQSFHSERISRGNNVGRDGDRRDMSIPWTMDGQIEHKVEWIDKVLAEFAIQSTSTPNLIFLSHSIGAHFTQCILLRRPDLLAKTQHVIHLMPFFRFDPPLLKKMFLSFSAQNYKFTIPIVTNIVRDFFAKLPRSWVDAYLEKVVGLDCSKGRSIAIDIFMHPHMMRNHLVLGLQECRELPEYPNDVALRLINNSPTSILFCGDPDQWAPKGHMEDLQKMQQSAVIPHNVYTEYIDLLRHDFVVHPEQIEPVINFVVSRIRSDGETSGLSIRSRL